MFGESGPGSNAARRSWKLAGPDGLQIEVLELGASWASCRLQVGNDTRELLLGFDSETDYLKQTSYIGATIGRYANRIAHGRVSWQGLQIELERAPGAPHHLHGGPKGFDRRRWRLIEHTAEVLHLALHSPDGDQGYPGALNCELSYRMLPGHAVELHFRAEVSRPCPVGLTSHPYFNLDGGGDARSQRLWIAADRYLPVDAEGIPAGPPCSLGDSGFDFRALRPIAPDVAGQTLAVYDHAFLLDPDCAAMQRPAVRLLSADRRVQLEIFTTLPALQLYTGEHLAQGTRECSSVWPDCSGIALEPQFLPDSPNHPEWPQPGCWLLPGQVYEQRIVYRFTVLE